jgi:hypothetical protein
MCDHLKPFTTDGCSDCGLSQLFGLFNKTIPATLHPLCVEHDRAYWRGGSDAERLAADIKFRDAIAAAGHPWIARLYFRAVRMGGVPWLPTSFRWGYGRVTCPPR